jgi:hypothetical protein
LFGPAAVPEEELSRLARLDVLEAFAARLAHRAVPAGEGRTEAGS